MVNMNKEDEALIQQYKDAWAKANAAGDQESMDRAHAGAEAVRQKYGYTGGSDGSKVTYNAPVGFNGSSTGVVTHSDQQAQIQNQMNQNSALWWDAKAAGDTGWMAALEEANRNLAAQLGGSVSFNSQTGTWGGAADAPLSLETGVDMQLPEFDLDDYGERPTFDLGAAVGERPTYASQYEGRIDALLNQILNREKFSYDAETDPLYQQYKNQYNREGNRAMNDTLAAAASGAGGMNSYAMTAAQQANDYYSAQLADKIPELYQLAYSMYMDDIAGQRNDLSMLQGAESMAYGKYLDSLDQWNTDRDFAYGAYRDSVGDWENDRNFGYSQYRDQMGDYQWGAEFNSAQDQWQKEFDYMMQQDALDREQWEQEFAYKQSKVGGSGGGDTDLGYEGGTDDEEEEETPKTNPTVDSSLRGADNPNYSDNRNNSTGTGTLTKDDKAQLQALGLSAYNMNYVAKLVNYGGIVEASDGSLRWAAGWNASNHLQKLSEAERAEKNKVNPFWYLEEGVSYGNT